MAEICLHMKAPKMAESSLEKALSHSFDVRLHVCQFVIIEYSNHHLSYMVMYHEAHSRDHEGVSKAHKETSPSKTSID